MFRHCFLPGVLVGLLLLALNSDARADRLVLKDGRVVEGTVIKQGERYWVKSPDGTTQYIQLDDVKALEKGNGAPKPGSEGSGTGALGAGSISAPGSLAATQRKANAADDPISAVSIWQSFIDSKPSEEDLKVAKQEIAHWQQLANDGAEKINGRWVSGEEYKTLKAKVVAMRKEIGELFANHETLRAESKLEELRRLYPNDYQVTFFLGFSEMERHNWDKANTYFEQVLKIKPNMPEAMANIAVGMWFKRKITEAIVQLDKAAKQGDTKEIAFDLCSMLNDAPRAFLQGQAGKTAIEDAHLLASKYNIQEESARGSLYFITPIEETAKAHRGEKGLVVGTGFILQPDGLIITNRHVVKDSKSLMVVINGKIEKSADIIKIDDQQDLALIRLKNNTMKLPTVQLAPSDLPSHGAECTVIGYPLFGRLGSSLKITHGIVSSAGNSEGGAKKLFGMDALGTDEIDVMVDAKVNPGNSGGPIVDKNGNIMAIVCMKSLSSETEDSYGMGISAGRIRKFLAKNSVAIPSGEIGKVGMSVEDIATKVEPATVLILATR